jgi:hypothetical protein
VVIGATVIEKSSAVRNGAIESITQKPPNLAARSRDQSLAFDHQTKLRKPIFQRIDLESPRAAPIVP